jgi:hypothetical protein
MSQIVNFFVFFMVVPVIYIGILLFDVMLIIRSRTLENRWRNMAGILVGFLVAVVFILLDQNFKPIISRSVNDDFEIAWSSAIIFGVVGFLVLLGIDFLLQRGVVAFVIIFTVAGVILSGYFLLSLSAIRTTTAVTTIGFLIGVILYFIFFPSRIFNTIRGQEAQTDD